VDGLWATKSECVGLIVRAISFQDFHVHDPDPPTLQLQIDRRTDGRTTYTLHYSASRGNNHYTNYANEQMSQ